MKDLVFSMEEHIYKQKAISDLLAMLAFTSENGIAISDFKEGVFFIYKMAFENYAETEKIWKQMMIMVTENDQTL